MHTVLTAHNGYAFDFRFLVMEMKSHRVNPEIFSNMHFADTFSSLRQIKPKILKGLKLSLEELHIHFFPEEDYSGTLPQVNMCMH